MFTLRALSRIHWKKVGSEVGLTESGFYLLNTCAQMILMYYLTELFQPACEGDAVSLALQT